LRATRLGLLAALMIVLGYPDVVATTNGTHLVRRILSIISFLWIVYEFFVSLSKSIKSQPGDVRKLLDIARNLVVGSWAFYPIVYFLGAVGLEGGASTAVIQIGYTIAEITAKAVFGVLIFLIAVRKSEAYFARSQYQSQPAERMKLAVRESAGGLFPAIISSL
jgi:bacteriorhodopsin